MKQADADQETLVAAASPWRILRWLDSLTWLAIAGTLTAMLVPARSAQVVSKRAGTGLEPDAVTAGHALPRPLHGQDDSQYFTSSHEFILQNEADFINAQHGAPSQTPDSSSIRR